MANTEPTRVSWGNPYDHSEYRRTTWTAASWQKNRPSGSAATFECDWCGTVKARLYSYGNEKHKFCDRQCKESYE